ncbi:MAG: glutamate--tRNA ligase [Planctomycetota bacterium]
MKNVRVRFAPSPTGYLHIGGARTALFNWLLARRHGGTFVLRVEDTDRERSTPEAVEAIFDGMRYLGLDWDEGPEAGGDCGPYFQAERENLHRKYVEQLMAKGSAYYCFATSEELKELRERQMANKERLHYDRRYADLDPGEAKRRVESGEKASVRFRVPEGSTTLKDLVRGDVTVDHREVEDFIIARSDGTPVYNLAVTADDHDMGITHVIRGEDHLTNTTKQILLMQALDLPLPQYAHIPLIMGKNGKLAKRDGAASVTEYRELGYLPEAMINFLVRMGWSLDDKTEIFSIDDLIKNFGLGSVSKSGAAYDIKKLEHLGGHYIREAELPRIVDLAVPMLDKEGFDVSDRERIEKIIELERERVSRVGEIPERRYYFEDPTEPDKGAKKALRKKKDSAPLMPRYAESLAAAFPDGWGVNDHEALEEHGKKFTEEAEVGLGDLAQPVRALVSGRAATPGLFEVLAILGKETVIRRLGKAEEWFALAQS